MYKPAKHVSFDADKREDQDVMILVNALAMRWGKPVAGVARQLLRDAAAGSVGASSDLYRQAMAAMGM
jgi:hypothetical protein